jgi:hypothetical protein
MEIEPIDRGLLDRSSGMEIEPIDRGLLDRPFDALIFLSNINDEFPCPQHPGRRQRNEPLH